MAENFDEQQQIIDQVDMVEDDDNIDLNANDNALDQEVLPHDKQDEVVNEDDNGNEKVYDEAEE